MKPSLLRIVSMLALLGVAACQPQPTDAQKQEPGITDRESDLIQLGRKVEKGGDVESAIGLYKQSIEHSKGNIDGHLALSRVYLDQGKIMQAEEILQKAKQMQPNDAEVNLRLGKIAIHKNAPKQALGFFEDGLKELNGNVDLLDGKGIALDMLARHTEAQLQYRRALAGAKTQYPFVENNLAMSFIMTGKYDEAIDLLQGVKDMETSPVMRQNLALAYGLKGDMMKAREWGGKDLTEKEMNDNIAFYQDYLKHLDDHPEQAVPEAEIPSVTLEQPVAAPAAVVIPPATAKLAPGVIPTTTVIEPIVPTHATVPEPNAADLKAMTPMKTPEIVAIKKPVSVPVVPVPATLPTINNVEPAANPALKVMTPVVVPAAPMTAPATLPVSEAACVKLAK